MSQALAKWRSSRNCRFDSPAHIGADLRKNQFVEEAMFNEQRKWNTSFIQCLAVCDRDCGGFAKDSALAAGLRVRFGAVIDFFENSWHCKNESRLERCHVNSEPCGGVSAMSHVQSSAHCANLYHASKNVSHWEKEKGRAAWLQE